MTTMDKLMFRDVLRLGRRPLMVTLQGDKLASEVWSNYDNARGIDGPTQRRPKVGHFSTPKMYRV